MNRKTIQPFRTIIDESYMTENKAYLLSVDEKFQLGYTNALFCKIGNDFYFLPMDTFLNNFIPYLGESRLKKISKDIIENIWRLNKSEIQKQFKINNLETVDEYMYAFIYCLDTEHFDEVSLGTFEELVD